MNIQANRGIHRRLDEQTGEQRNKQTTRWTNRRTEEDGEMSGDTFMSTILIAFFLELDRRKILWKIMINSKREVIYWNSHWLKKNLFNCSLFKKKIFSKKHGPVPKKTPRSNFSYKNTYYEAISDLRPKRKNVYVKIWDPDMIPQKNFN